MWGAASFMWRRAGSDRSGWRGLRSVPALSVRFIFSLRARACTTSSIGTTGSLGSRSTTFSAMAPDPVICAMQLHIASDRREELDAWLAEGRSYLEVRLASSRPRQPAPTSRLITGQRPAIACEPPVVAPPHLQRCFQWIHVPSGPGVVPTDTLTLMFTKNLNCVRLSG